MSHKRETALTPRETAADPFTLLRQLTAGFDRFFDRPFTSIPWPTLPAFALPDGVEWAPKIDVFERDHQLVTKIDLPGLKKDDVKVEVTDGYLAISGERKNESEKKEDNVYRRERSYGSFYRAVPLPDGVKLEDVKATFADGVLEVSVPLPAQAQPRPRTVAIEEPAAKAAA
jgi:HSP20 family protein